MRAHRGDDREQRLADETEGDRVEDCGLLVSLSLLYSCKMVIARSCSGTRAGSETTMRDEMR